MKAKQNIQKISFSIILMMAIQVAYAAFSFTGIADEHGKNSKYSLKNLNAYSRKSLTYSAMKSNLQFRGTQLLSNKDNQNSSEMNYMLRFENGNSTFVYPYKFKVRVPTKFKTPVAPHH
jgi:hypothetical protein